MQNEIIIIIEHISLVWSFRRLFSFALFHLLLHHAGSLLCGDIFELLMELENSLIINRFVDVDQQSFISDHTLGEFDITHSVSTQVLGKIINQNQWLFLYKVFCVSLSQ